mmetsp:Transcript_118872/g.233493  ORF Transcript_118872/g.233493 Transcript_118872/m.233493 type:complete len:201 (+) Transcript_118872:163-765(+)
MSSIILITFSNPEVLPFNASSMRSRPGETRPLLATAARIIFNALARWAVTDAESWTKLELAPGNVPLKSSKESSSLSTLIVSARANSSSARVFLTSSHSASLVEQPASNSCLNLVSSSSASFVSSTSLAISARRTPRLPTRVILSSICACNEATSFCFAARSSSWFLMALSSAAVASLRLLDISSWIVFKIPMISPDWGT